MLFSLPSSTLLGWFVLSYFIFKIITMSVFHQITKPKIMHFIVVVFFRNPASFLHAYTYLPLPCATRQAVAAILQDVSDSGVIYSMLMSKYKVFFFFFFLPHKWISFMYFIFFKCRL